MSLNTGWIERLYDAINREKNGRACEAISKQACDEVPRNFFLLLISNTLTKVGDRLASPKTTLSWLLQAIGAPAVLTGLIVPIRESGSMIPQMFLAGLVRRLPIRKCVWVVGSVVQGFAIGGMAVVAAFFEGAGAGWSIVGLTAVFALARGLSSIASKDVRGKTIPKARRGFLGGLMGSASGVLAIVAGVALLLQRSAETGSAAKSTGVYVVYLLIGASLWFIASAVFSLVREFEGETNKESGAWSQTVGKLALLKGDAVFRHFVITRALAIGSGMSAPFVVSLAHRALGGASFWLGAFVVADGMAAMVSGPVFGRWADRSSRRLLAGAMVGFGALLVMTLIVGEAAVTKDVARIVYPSLFFLLSVAHNGVRLGRKTYLIDMAEGNKRTDYVAVSNTVIGVLLLAAGAVTGLLSLVSVSVVLGLFAACGFLGALLAIKLPEVSE